jgi:putative methyltransferase (TIGR04325 family)
MAKIKKIIKSFIPPIILDFFSSFRKSALTWNGNYESWNAALLESEGYGKLEILEKCKDSLLRVKNKEAIYERDSVIFDTADYSWPLLSQIQKSAMHLNRELVVLDFGGSLGSTYYQIKSFLEDTIKLKWCIVEQGHFVETGELYFQNEELLFFKSIDEAIAAFKPDLILLSSVLQYLEKPYDIVQKLCSLNVKYIIIDRTPMSSIEKDMITVQSVPEEIYNASYPSWIFSEKKFLNQFYNYGNEIKFNNGFTNSIVLNNHKVEWNGFILKLIK